MERLKQVFNKISKFLLYNINDVFIFIGVAIFICTMFSISHVLGWVILSIVLILYGILLSYIKAKFEKKAR